MERGQKLASSRSLYQYLREARDLQDWINDQMITAQSEDYGQDFEHVQVRLVVVDSDVCVRCTAIRIQDSDVEVCRAILLFL